MSAKSRSKSGRDKRPPESSPITDLSAAETSELFEDLNYVSLAELRELCRTYEIPYRIRIKLPDGSVRTTAANDRKGVVLARLRRFLETGERLAAAVLSASVAGPATLSRCLAAADRIHFRWYERTNAPVFDLLRTLTDGRFRDGARARTLLMAHWSAGRAPTFSEFAAEWLSAEQGGESMVSPEYAYLTDLQAGRADPDWKALRRQRARRALSRLNPPHRNEETSRG